MPTTPFSTRLPRWAHAIPYVALVVLGAVLLLPGAVTLAAMVAPQTRAASLVVGVMVADWFGLLFGAAILAVPAVAGSIAWTMMRGPRALRAAQIGAWTTLLLTLPLIMGLTYEVVRPMCWG